MMFKDTYDLIKVSLLVLFFYAPEGSPDLNNSSLNPLEGTPDHIYTSRPALSGPELDGTRPGWIVVVQHFPALRLSTPVSRTVFSALSFEGGPRG